MGRLEATLFVADDAEVLLGGDSVIEAGWSGCFFTGTAEGMWEAMCFRRLDGESAL